MKPRVLRHLIIALLTLSGVFHFLTALVNGAPGFGVHLAVFGALFVVIGFLARSDTKDGSKSHSRNAIIAAIAACTVSVGFSGYALPRTEGLIALVIIAVADLAVIAAGVMWLVKAKPKKKR